MQWFSRECILRRGNFVRWSSKVYKCQAEFIHRTRAKKKITTKFVYTKINNGKQFSQHRLNNGLYWIWTTQQLVAGVIVHFLCTLLPSIESLSQRHMDKWCVIEREEIKKKWKERVREKIKQVIQIVCVAAEMMVVVVAVAVSANARHRTVLYKSHRYENSSFESCSIWYVHPHRKMRESEWERDTRINGSLTHFWYLICALCCVIMPLYTVKLCTVYTVIRVLSS